jgi:hypothetical protein
MQRPAFQHQGPATNCVIDGNQLGWKSCTAYAMAMLIDAATDGTKRPKGCMVRRLVRPTDVTKGLFLSQVAAVAELEFGLPISVRTGPNAVSVAKATEQIRRGRGFLLQGNNLGFGLGDVNHAIYVHEVRGGTPERPDEALVFDPQRMHERWMPWGTVLAFGAELRVGEPARPLGPARLYAGFPRIPVRPHGALAKAHPQPMAAAAAAHPVVVTNAVALRFGATKLPHRDRTVAHPPPGRLVNVRRTPRNLARQFIVDTLPTGAPFIAFQRLDDGVRPPGAPTRTWFGNRDGTQWVHESGLRMIGGDE